MSMIRAICVYCGSSPGADPAFAAAAEIFGRILAENGLRLVYGGGAVGLMGVLANSVLNNGGQVTGVIPEFLTDREKKLTRNQKMIITRDMHERKKIMFDEADAFVALPGGIGTVEELVEQMTWARLGQHRKPILVANINGFWQPLIALFDHLVRFDFVQPTDPSEYLVVEHVEQILPALRNALKSTSETSKQGDAFTIDRM